MLKDISKKLTMKKTFFTTQLEGFFNSISQEYQTLIHDLEVEKRVVEEKLVTLQKDVDNLVAIKQEYEKNRALDKQRIKELQESLAGSREMGSSAYMDSLLDENKKLKKELQTLKENYHDSEEVKALQEKIQKLQGFLSKGANAYTDNIISEQKETIIREISESLKK